MSDPAPSSPAAPSSSATSAPPAPPSWRKRHPVLARACLYGGALALMGGGLWIYRDQREKGRQDGLLTKINGVEMNMRLVPEGIRVLTEDVLAQRPSEDVRRRALLALAACYDAQERFGEADATYAIVEREWPQGRPQGALYLPWANERVRAGRPKEALEMLDRPGATAGEAETEVEHVRLWARRKLEQMGAGGGGAPTPAGPGAGAEGAGMGGGAGAGGATGAPPR